jgi:formylglycine-generating enzyme required for sulfatase activity
MVVIPAWSFTMGSPESELGRNKLGGSATHGYVRLRIRGGKYEVTVGQFAAFVRETGYRADGRCWTLEKGKLDSRTDRSWRNPGYAQDGSYPPVCLSWSDASAYVDWLARRTGEGYRLLTEAEWEYAAGGQTAPGPRPRYGFGDEAIPICNHANGLDQTAKRILAGTWTWQALHCFDGYAYAAPVGQFSANAFGLYDMVGNAKEWVADCYHET